MSIHPDFPDDPAHVPRGAAPVGLLHELPPVEATAVVFLRSWCHGGLAQARIAQEFALVLTPADAADAAAGFDALMTLVLSCARRSLMRHDVGCSCYGGDESAFANLVAAAAQGETDDAMLFAGILLSAPATFDAVLMARALAQPFLRLARHALNQSTPVASSRIH